MLMAVSLGVIMGAVLSLLGVFMGWVMAVEVAKNNTQTKN